MVQEFSELLSYSVIVLVLLEDFFRALFLKPDAFTLFEIVDVTLHFERHLLRLLDSCLEQLLSLRPLRGRDKGVVEFCPELHDLALTTLKG